MALDGPLSHREEILRAVDARERDMACIASIDDRRSNNDWVALIIQCLGCTIGDSPPKRFKEGMLLAVTTGVAALETQARREAAQARGE